MVTVAKKIETKAGTPVMKCEISRTPRGGAFMFKKMLLVAVSSLVVSLSAFAVDTSKVEKSIEMKDGSTVYIFKDGKMGMEDKVGRATRMKPGQIMEAKDGQKLIMIGDEVMRVDSLMHKDNRH